MHIDQVVVDQLLEERALLRQLADDVLALDRVHVALGTRDVDVAADHELAAFHVHALRPGAELAHEGELRRVILAAVRHVDRGEHQVAAARGDDARLHVELRVAERRLGEALPHVQRDARIGAQRRAVPIDVICVGLALLGHLLDARLQLLQAEDIGLLALEELAHLRRAGADAVHVPGRDLHK